MTIDKIGLGFTNYLTRLFFSSKIPCVVSELLTCQKTRGKKTNLFSLPSYRLYNFTELPDQKTTCKHYFTASTAVLCCDASKSSCCSVETLLLPWRNWLHLFFFMHWSSKPRPSSQYFGFCVYHTEFLNNSVSRVDPEWDHFFMPHELSQQGQNTNPPKTREISCSLIFSNQSMLWSIHFKTALFTGIQNSPRYCCYGDASLRLNTVQKHHGGEQQ